MTRRNPFTPWFTSVLYVVSIVLIGLASRWWFLA